MKTILASLLNPLIIFWLLIIFFAVAYWLKRRRLARILVCVALCWLFLVSASPLPVWLIMRCESNYPVLDPARLDTASELHILVLGAGHSNAPLLQPQNKLHGASLARLVEAIRIYRNTPGSKIICSGASSSGTTQAEATALAAISLGVSPSDTVLLPGTHSTADEARDYVKRFADRYPLVVVTNAFHMPRAIEYFREKGLQPVAAPTGHFIKSPASQGLFNFKPSATKIQMTGNLLHEYGGWLQLKFDL